MNWFTKQSLHSATTEKKKLLMLQYEGCEHCIADPSKAAALAAENDSHGIVDATVICLECIEKQEAEEKSVMRFCTDCKTEFKQSDGLEWRWYDFYAPQGDKPLYICKGCRTKPNHVERVNKDREDYEAEMGDAAHASHLNTGLARLFVR